MAVDYWQLTPTEKNPSHNATVIHDTPKLVLLEENITKTMLEAIP